MNDQPNHLKRHGRPKVTAWQKQRAVDTLKAMSVEGIAPSRAEWMKHSGCFEAWLTRATGTLYWLDALAALGLKSKRVQSALCRAGGGRQSSGKPCLNDATHPSPLEGNRYCETCHLGWEGVGIVAACRVGSNRHG